jgi:hypothetical protein
MSARCVVDSELELELRLGGARRVEIAQSRFVPDKSGLSIISTVLHYPTTSHESYASDHTACNERTIGLRIEIGHYQFNALSSRGVATAVWMRLERDASTRSQTKPEYTRVVLRFSFDDHKCAEDRHDVAIDSHERLMIGTSRWNTPGYLYVRAHHPIEPIHPSYHQAGMVFEVELENDAERRQYLSENDECKCNQTLAHTYTALVQ